MAVEYREIELPGPLAAAVEANPDYEVTMWEARFGSHTLREAAEVRSRHGKESRTPA